MILNEIKLKIVKAVSQVLGDTALSPGDLEYPPNAAMGDLALPMFNIAQDKKENPSKLAQSLLPELSRQKIRGVATIKTQGPYLNFVLDKKYIFNELNKSASQKDFGRNKSGGKQKVLIEFANQNTHKEFHVGHLRNISFGDAINRILAANGYKTIPISYINDFGIHVAKTLWAYLAYYQDQPLPANKGKFLGEIYVRASTEIKEDPHKADLAKFMMKKIESRRGEEYELWQKTRQWSLEQFEQIYKELGVEFEKFYYESDFIDQGRELVPKLKEKGILKDSQGAVIADLEDQGLGVLVVLRSDGTATYPVADIPLAAAKHKQHKPDISIYVVDNRQALYFRQLFAILQQMGHSEELKHLQYDFVKLPSGMMSSRSGNTVTYDDLKKELEKVLAQETKDRHPDWSEAEVDDTVKALAVATIKFELLKVGAEQVITFDIKEALSFSGYTAAYILYSYARLQSILRKADVKLGKKIDAALEGIEEQLIMKMAKYPEAVAEAGKRYDPSVLAKYAYELAQAVNDYYHQVPVLKAEKKFREQRLKLLEDCCAVLQAGLGLLGIGTIERM